MRRLSVAMPGEAHGQLATHLLRPDGQEDLCFALYRPSTGERRDSCLIQEVILPNDGERLVHGNASFSGEYFLRAADLAEEANAGLALAHSHPAGKGWQGMSRDDVVAEQRYAAQTPVLTGFPLLGLTLAGDESWSARRWDHDNNGYRRHDSASVRVAGEQLRISHHPDLSPTIQHDERMLRTVSAWGEAVQQDLARQHIGIIGAGSVGALVAESLARTGVQRLTIIDFDTIKAHNLDRLAHATRLDAHLHLSKAQRLRETLLRYGTARDIDVDAVELSVVEPHGYRAALDCDVLFSCVDRPWPRQLLNHIAYAHLIPVVDGGISIRARPRLTNADWKAHIAAPGRACLECLGQYLAADVALERAGDLDDPSYINSLPVDHRLRASQNVYAFSSACASLEVLQWLSMTVAPLEIADVGAWNFHFVTGQMDQSSAGCASGCLQQQHLAGGDLSKLAAPIAEHPAAKKERSRRWAAQAHFRTRTLLRLRSAEREIARRIQNRLVDR